jgi:hypothetical protein
MKKFSATALALALVLAAGCSLTHKKVVPLKEKKGTPDHTPLWQYEGFTIARGSMHNHTIFSDGCLTVDDLVQEARNEGVSVLAITDHREGKQCLGKRGKVCVDAGGVESPKLGYEKYLQELERVAAESKNPIIIPGLEVAPYVWNERGFPFMILRGSNWHFTVYNVSDPSVYAEMPAFRGVTVKKNKAPLSDPFNNIEPYNRWVNYLRDRGAIVAQAHPQWGGENSWALTVRTESQLPLFMTDQLPRLNIVALMPEGFNASIPGGKWDKALMQYLAGFREEPLWAWGEADFHCLKDEQSMGLRLATTLFYLKDYSRAGVLDAIHKGRMVALMGKDFQEVYVSEFSVGSGKPASQKIMLGEEVKLDGAPMVRFALSREVPVVETRLVRNGKVIHVTNATSFQYLDREALDKKLRCYYRVQVIGQGPMLLDDATMIFTNPVFVSFK